MKYLALIGLLVAVAVLGLGGWMATRTPQVPAPMPLASSTAAAADPAVIARDILAVRQLEAQLGAVSARAFEPRHDRSLIAFVATPPELVAQQDKTAAEPAATGLRQARVSLLYAGEGFNRAVVDGQYVKTGDRLPEGGRVLAISEDSVTVRNGGRRQVLRVPEARRVAGSSN